ALLATREALLDGDLAAEIQVTGAQDSPEAAAAVLLDDLVALRVAEPGTREAGWTPDCVLHGRGRRDGLGGAHRVDRRGRCRLGGGASTVHFDPRCDGRNALGLPGHRVSREQAVRLDIRTSVQMALSCTSAGMAVIRLGAAVSARVARACAPRSNRHSIGVPPWRRTKSSISSRAMLSLGGTGGSSSGRNQSASAISVGSGTISPPAQRAVKPIMSELVNGHGWLPK